MKVKVIHLVTLHFTDWDLIKNKTAVRTGMKKMKKVSGMGGGGQGRPLRVRGI